MGIINTQAVADGRKVRTGKDGALYNGKGKLLATVEVFQAQMGVANQKYHPLGTPLEQEILDSIGTTLTFTECVVEDGEFITDLLKMQNTGIQPNWKLQGVVKGINGCIGRKHCKTSVVPVREWRSKTAGKIKGLRKIE